MHKHHLLSLLLLLAAPTSRAEQPDSVSTPATRTAAKAVTADILGENLFGVSYDARFRGRWGWGYRVGVGYNRDVEKNHLTYTYGNEYSDYRYKSTASGLGVPLEINYLVGRRLHQFEVGLGTVLGFYKDKKEVTALYQRWEGEGDERTTTSTEIRASGKDTHFGWYAYGNVGYRFHTRRGFLLRLGMQLGCGGGYDTPYRQSWSLRPYLGLGYTFPNAAIGQKTDLRKMHVPDTVRIRGYRGFGEVVGGVVGWPFLGISTTHGYRFSQQWFVGAGVALTTEGIPVFANARFNMTKRQTAPVLDAKLGYNCGYVDSPLYTSVGLGVDHRFTPKLSISFLFSYLHTEDDNGWTMNLGVEF